MRGQEWIVGAQPRRSLARHGALAVLIFSGMLLASLAMIGLPADRWPTVLVADAALLVGSLVGYLLYRRTFIGVSGHELVERGFVSRERRVALENVSRAAIHETYRTDATDSTPQLIALDSSGRTLLRMRGVFWSDASIREVALALGVPVADFPDPVTAPEFFALYPGSAYWFENRRSVLVFGVVGVGLVALAAILGLMQVTGIPLDGG